MINISLEQKNKLALTIPDGLMQEFVTNTIAEHAEKGDVTLTIGNEHILVFFRLAIKEGKLDASQMNATCYGEPFLIDSDGNYNKIPPQLSTDWETAMLKMF